MTGHVLVFQGSKGSEVKGFVANSVAVADTVRKVQDRIGEVNTGHEYRW
jgi:hypothetical protein